MAVTHLTMTDVGPIERLTIPVPQGGGIVVLRGRNGSGKSTALNAVGSLLSGKPSVGIRDGATKAEIDGFGATLRLGRRSSRSGELEVVSLEGRMSPADLVDPGLKSEDAADAARIKALLQLVSATPDVKDFWVLIGGQQFFEEACPEDLTSVTDAVTLASRVKRSFEATARRKEAAAEHEAGKSAAYRKGAESVDVTVVTDAERLQSDLEAAVSEQTRLTTEARTAQQLATAAESARRQLAEIDASGADETDYFAMVDEARNERNQRDDDLAAAMAASAEAAEALRVAKQRFEDAQAVACRAEEASRQAVRNVMQLEQQAQRHVNQHEQREQLKRSLQKTIESAAGAKMPSTDDIEAAGRVVTRTREAIEKAAIARRAQEQLATAAEHEARAKALVKEASQIRDAAKGTDDVLSAMVAKCGTPLIVRDGRLWLETKRGLTLFAELSHGERWKVAIDVAVNAFTGDSEHLPVLTIPQEAFEGLDGINREIVAKHARDCGVLILTAECSTDASIKAEVLNG